MIDLCIVSYPDPVGIELRSGDETKIYIVSCPDPVGIELRSGDKTKIYMIKSEDQPSHSTCKEPKNEATILWDQKSS